MAAGKQQTTDQGNALIKILYKGAAKKDALDHEGILSQTTVTIQLIFTVQ
jgi:hypothetical protein